MADAISIQELIDARTDAKTLEEAVNGDAVTTVLSRLGETYPTLSNALNQIDSKLDSADAQIKLGITNLFENGGLPATPFATKALMTASALVDGDYAMVTSDTDNNGLYVKTAGSWVKSGYDPLAQANAYTDLQLSKSSGTFDTLALLTASTLADNAYALVANETDLTKNGHYKKLAGVWTRVKYDPVAIAATDATTKANTAKSEAISASATDATTKANAAKSEAISAAATDATTKANTAEANAKTYADTNKLDLSTFGYEYVDGNKIGPKTPRYTNLGISGGIFASTSVDSLVLRVNAGDVLFILNDEGVTASNVGARIAFFADDPNLNRSQTAIADTREVISVPSVHWKITVPSGAKYLMMNTRTLTGNGTYNLTWAVHKDSFNASFETGREVITSINSTPITDEVASTDAATKANAAEENAKAYADTTKLDLSKITTEYEDGNKIGPKTPHYTNLGLSAGSILAQATFDSLVLSVSDQDVLFIQNQQDIYTTAARIAFFAEDPNTNRTQSSIGHTAEVVQTPIQHWKVIVPTGAKYLMMNTRLYAAGATTNFTWAVHKDEYNASFTAGKEVITKIHDLPIWVPGDFAKSAAYSAAYTDQKISELEFEDLTTSSKNLFTGVVRTDRRLSGNGTSASNSIDNIVSNFIPVEFGKTYTISGINHSYINGPYRRINGYGTNTDDSYVKSLSFTQTNDGFTFTNDDAAVKYVLFPISSLDYGTYDVAVSQPIQFEVGSKATEYEPYKAPLSLLKTAKALKSEISKGLVNTKPMYINQFIELNKVRDAMSKVGVISKNMSPTGIVYEMQGLGSEENASNVLYTQYTASENGTKGIYVNLMKYVAGSPTLGVLSNTPFTVPSGMLDNGGVATEYANTYPKYDYCHPSIDYDATGVGGFKYWMITSILPGGVTTDATWEDEDLFVSNDAKNWQRVRSMYESDKTYTTATLRLPPQSIHTATERKHGFLPCPSLGDTFEMSMPAYGSMPAVDRQMITMNDRTPFKHDPCLFIDGGYVYTYHSFHMPYSERSGGTNKFLICVRTNNGVDWEVVRSDGSTMLLTEETSRQIFTKDDQGRYNYTHYSYNRGFGNPEVIKWGDSDYELFWGGNFSLKFAGSTPYTFDFSNEITVQDKGFGNHPGLLQDGNDLYALGSTGFFKSTDRGVRFTKLTYYPFWLGGVSGYPYKKALCKGEGGKIIVADVERYFMPYYSIRSEPLVSSIGRVNLLSLYEYSSLADLVVRANEGLVDAYLDFQLCKINYQTGMREFVALQSVSLNRITSNVNSPLSRFKLCDMSFNAGDNLHIYVTLNSRCGAKIEFGGIDIS